MVIACCQQELGPAQMKVLSQYLCENGTHPETQNWIEIKDTMVHS